VLVGERNGKDLSCAKQTNEKKKQSKKKHTNNKKKKAKTENASRIKLFLHMCIACSLRRGLHSC
jgi:sulfur relay (sulfurtransferase) complex TusBCD TusD component (DsrE family)